MLLRNILRKHFGKAPNAAVRDLEDSYVEKNLLQNEIEFLIEKLEDESLYKIDAVPLAIKELNRIKGQLLSRQDSDYWKYHCVTCGLWLNGEPDQEGYCQCE